jgi:hypothetical protein
MTEDERAVPGLSDEAKRRQERQRERRATALRENLLKRKQQSRARTEADESAE